MSGTTNSEAVQEAIDYVRRRYGVRLVVRGQGLRDALAMPELAALRADAERVKRVRELADEIDSHHAPYCCKVECPEPGGRHGDPTDPVRIEELVGILGDNPPPLREHRRLPCPRACTCPSGPAADRIRRTLDGSTVGEQIQQSQEYVRRAYGSGAEQ